MLLQRRLTEAAPGQAWRCVTRPLHFGARMAEMAVRHVEATMPEAVVISLVESPFTWRNPMGRIRRRWPRFYPYARRIADRLKGAAGGGNVNSVRGLVFRAPRRLLCWVVGAEPEVDVEDAVAATIATLEALARREELCVVMGMTRFPASRQGRRAAAHQAIVSRFQAPIREACLRQHVAFYDRVEEAERAGFVIGYGNDRDYANLESRSFEAGLMASRVLAGLQGGT
jgi:hypothetical protein